MQAAGWSGRDRTRALAEWHDVDGLPPVPRPRPGVEVLLALFRHGTLAFLAVQAVEAAYAPIDIYLSDPDPDLARWALDPAPGAFRWAVATAVVLLPVWAWLALRARRRVRAETALRRATARLWPAPTIMAVAAAVYLSASVTVIHGYPVGDGTLPAGLMPLANIPAAAGAFALTRPDLAEG